MTPQVAEQGKAEERPQGNPAVTVSALGKHIPNLVLIWDSEQGKPPEFRIQLEVELDKETALKVAENLWGMNPRNSGKLGEAKGLVLANVPGPASKTFRDIITMAFEDQPEIKK